MTRFPASLRAKILDMTVMFYLMIVSLFLGLGGLLLFLWALRNGQYEDLEGTSQRILFDDDDDQ